MPDYKDYDALAGEKKPFIRRIGGKDIEPSKKLPARVALEAQRLARGNMSDNEALDFLLSFGERVLKDEWEHCLDHLEVKELTELVKDLMVYYGLREEEAADGPKAEETETESPSPISSITGGPLTPTLNDFGLVAAPDSTQAS